MAFFSKGSKLVDISYPNVIEVNPGLLGAFVYPDVYLDDLFAGQALIPILKGL